MRDNSLMGTTAVLMLLIALVAGNHVIFSNYGIEYWHWYVQNGSLVGAITAIVAIAWGDVDRNPQLISANPRNYVTACLIISALPLLVLGVQTFNLASRLKGGTEAKMQKELELIGNTLLALPMLIGIFLLVLFWLVCIAPAQYFVFVVCGAMARSLGLSSTKVIVRKSKRFGVRVDEIASEASVPEGWWDASFHRKPVTVTAVTSALVFLLIRSALGI